jgi:DNA-binding winged helix-turn-helix (wHTH) protein
MTETEQPSFPGLIQLDGLTIDLDDYCIRYADGTESQLSGQEQMLLNTLIEASGRVVTMEELGRLAWGFPCGYSAGAIWHCVSALRRKLGDNPSHPRYIQTVRRIGYRIRLPRTTRTTGKSHNQREATEGPGPASEPAHDPAPEPTAAPRRKERANARRKH